MKKEIWLIIILALIIVVLAGISLWPKGTGPLITEPGIQILTPKLNAEISSPLVISGYINGAGWTAFEAQAGTVKLLDENNNVLGTALLAITDESWMKQFNNFKGELSFVSSKDQNGTLVFKNENASGDPVRDKTFVLPVKIKKSSSATAAVKAYFNNSKMDPEFSCNKVFSVSREIAETEAVAREALEQLLSGPTDAEKNAGFFTSIPAGSNLNSISIVNGEARADFNDITESGGGSCSMAARVAQITKTLMQFPTITSVRLSINGRTGDIFQP